METNWPRITWLKKGDRDITFSFPLTMAPFWKRSKFITSPVDNGMEYSHQEEITSKLHDFFRNLFVILAISSTVIDWNVLYSCPSVDLEPLVADFIGEEIKCAVFSLSASKAPGANSFPIFI